MFKEKILKVSTVTPVLHVGLPIENAKEMIKVLKNTKSSLVVFPELSLTGYTAGDLFYQSSLIDDSTKGLAMLLDVGFSGVCVVGMPLCVDEVLYNCAVVFTGNKILGVVPKYYNPTKEEYNEKRWFSSGFKANFTKVNILGQKASFGQIVFSDEKNDIKFGIEISQDMLMPVTPGNLLSLAGANLIINISAVTNYLNEDCKRKKIIVENSRKNHGAYIYVSSGSFESSSEAIFSGHNIHAIMGELVNQKHFDSFKTEEMTSDIDFGHINYSRRKDIGIKESLHQFKTDYQIVDFMFKESANYVFAEPLNKEPLLFTNNKKNFEKVRNIQIRALARRLTHLGNPKVIIGVSGGLDSSLALLVAVDTFKFLKRDLGDIIAISMPGLATKQRTRNNAEKLSLGLGVSFKEIDIKDEVNQQFKMILQEKTNQDVVYENAQARIRTMTLMNLANKNNGIVLGTGSLSEIALGYMTYNADQMSMYAINSGLPKTLVKRQFCNYQFIYEDLKDIILDIIDTPISAELVENQETELLIGSYQINDYLIYRHLVAGDDKEKMAFMLKHAFSLKPDEVDLYVSRFLNRFYSSQFKRQVMPDGPKVIKLSLSPRSGYKLNSDVKKK